MTKSQKRWLFVVVTVFILAALILAETTKHFFGIWIASTIYDNRAIFLSCDELPDLSDVKSVMEQHNQVIQEIKNIDPENIEITELVDVRKVIAKYTWDDHHFDLFTKDQIEEGKRSSALMALGFFGAEKGMSDNEIYSLLIFGHRKVSME